MDVVADQGRLALLLAVRSPGRDDSVVMYAASADGRTWNRPIKLPISKEGVASHSGNDVRLAVRGQTSVAVWQSKGSLPGSGPLTVVRSKDGGKTWQKLPSPAADDPTGNQSEPDIALDARGAAHLVWLDDREENGNTQGLRYARLDSSNRGWQAKSTVDASVCTCCWTRLALLSEREPLVLYRDDVPHDMGIAGLATDGKWRFHGPVGRFDWQFSGCPHCGGALSFQRTGSGTRLHSVVWTGKEGSAGLYYQQSVDQGGQWTTPLRVGGKDDRLADIAVTATGNLGLVYSQDSGKSAVFFRRSADNGNSWTEPVAVSAPGNRADHPRIVAIGNGFRVFWTERQATGAVIAMSDPDRITAPNSNRQ